KNNWFAYIVDEKTLEEITPFCPQNSPCVEPYEINGHGLEDGQYVWIVTVTGQPPNILSGRSWGYMIDAKNGPVLNPIQNTAVLEPTDPQVSVKEGTLISQARGNVTIVFPADISKEEPRQSPFPAQLIITKGDTVTWRNDDNVPHTVTSSFPQQQEFIGQIFDSGIIGSGQSFSHTFSDERITGYSYFCTIHPWETGKVIVQHLESD
ncbi:MAG: cupredoxin domain-containing protein, partial [Nitrosopumilaceae archaeon]